MKVVNFSPPDFGGFTFFLILSGLTFKLTIFGVIASFAFFLASMYFYARSNQTKDKDKIITIEE